MNLFNLWAFQQLNTTVTFLRSGVQLSPQLTMLDVFGGVGHGQIDDMELMIFGQRFRVAYNLPWVNVITLPSSMLAGYLTYPTKLEMQCADLSSTSFQWFISAEVVSTHDTHTHIFF